MNRSKDISPKEWVKRESGKHLCKCGCCNPIPVTIHHYKKSNGIPDYLLGHNSRGNGNSSYKGVDKWIKENQDKIECACGCGEVIKIKKHHHYDPKFYIRGHNSIAENNPNWQGGISKYDRTRNSAGIRKWRNLTLQRDNYRCQMPGCINPYNPNIHVHHIIPVSVRESLAFDVDNGITLCALCHCPIRGKEDRYEELFMVIIEQQKVR